MRIDNNGYSSLVAWTPTGEIILPKGIIHLNIFKLGKERL